MPVDPIALGLPLLRCHTYHREKQKYPRGKKETKKWVGNKKNAC
jgi:hypothetical protein